MEALHNQTTGEQSGGQEHHLPESPQQDLQPVSSSQTNEQKKTSSSKPHRTPQQPKQSRKHNPERKRLRHQRQSLDSDTAQEHKSEASAAKEPSSVDVSGQAKPKDQEDNPKQKRERKPQRPGKYVCTYCGRPCAKPSVLQKHIRSHTGERPYPCAPCGFSFKTKSNLYKHRKSHTHRVKAGLSLGEPKSLEEQVTESEDETRQLSSDRQSSVSLMKSHETDRAKNCSGGGSDSYAVKKRLALRLSRGKHSSQDSSEEKISSLMLDSRGSTESGYFSRSESTEQSQESPPNTSAKSYAEIILGKYGRLGQLQRMSRHHNQHPSGQEEKNISFTVPKKQVIDHITKLITINEAVVDTSKIDSVKPRRFSLSRKNSSESQKGSNSKEMLIHSPKAGDLGYKSTGSISMGVPCEKFHHPPVHLEQPAGPVATGPLVRSLSLPSAGSLLDASGDGLCKFRLSQSFDERQPSETQVSRRYGTLKRQPAIEIPLGSELTTEEQEVSCPFYSHSVTTLPTLAKPLPQPYECEACGIGCKDWEGYKKHKQSLCLVHPSKNEVVVCQMECSQLSNLAVRAGASTIRKRRKEESFEFDDPSSPPLPFSAVSSGQCQDESSIAHEGRRRPALQTCSVIQHTSSFEKQDSLCPDNQSLEGSKSPPPHEDYQLASNKQPHHQLSKLPPRKLVRQNSVKVPEILVTEDFSVRSEILVDSATTAKTSEKPDEFQWPQRSSSLAQLPIEKLPPKKKRLRLAEATQSSGESSFESLSLSRSPSQDSSASYASSRSTSFDEPNRPDMEVATSTPLRRSRASNMLTVPGEHQHREMRRSASEQAPHDPQPSVLMVETRSRSFDYSCLSPERSAIGWKERRKCLLMRHAAIRDRDEEEDHCSSLRRSPEHVSPSISSPSSSPSPAGRLLGSTAGSQHKETFSQWKLSQKIPITDSATHNPSMKITKEVPCIQPSQPNPTYGPSGAARAHYLPVSTGLKLEIPSRCDKYSEGPIQQSIPHITSSLEILTPFTCPAVAVRLQTNTLTPACAIYTTLSQSMSPMPQEALGAVSPSTGMSTVEYRHRRSMSPDLNPWFDDSMRSSSSGGNKRMLSPSNSMELHPESQQQQKRVKEEEEDEAGHPDTPTEDVPKQENQPCLPAVASPVSFPSLLSSTCNSWCYLNYIKPNPSTLDEQKPSVYSSWSTSSYDPNPPGLSSKTVLSLLHCKQRLSPSIYTTSPMSVQTTQSMEQEDGKRPCSSEVCISPSYIRDQEAKEKGLLHPDNESDAGKETKKEKKKEIVSAFSRNKPSPERRSNTQHDAAEDEDEEDCRCEDSRFLCEIASEVSTESSPRNCNRCRSTLKAAGTFAEHLRADAPESPSSCYAADTHEGVFENPSVHSDQSDVGQSPARHQEDAGGQHNDGQDEDSKSAVTGGDEAHPDGSPSLPVTPQKSSARARRALFARRRLDVSESPSSRAASPCSGRNLSPPPNLSCRPHPSPDRPSSSTYLASADSPVPGLSSAPEGCAAGVSAHCPPCPHLTDQMSTARRLAMTHVAQQPSRLGSCNLLSHLPLHSQQPSRSQSLLIPIGGIHMIQPRSPLPLYRLASSTSASRGKGSLAVPPLQDILRETSPGPKIPEQIPADVPSDTRDRDVSCARQRSSPETKPPESPVRESRVYIETSQGQKQAPSSQTQL